MIRSKQCLWLAMHLLSVLAGCSRSPDQSSPDQTSLESYSSPKETIANSIGMNLVLIPKGTFTMGSPIEEKGRNEDEQRHQVTISKDYFIGEMEVTQGQYERMMGENWSFFRGRRVKGESSNHPVENVSWKDAVEFCKRLSELPEEKTAGRVYRLPTNAEWEYACRAGSTTAYSIGASSKSLGDYAWCFENSGDATHPVGEKKPNAWGLYDMNGNVWEWCSDWYGAYPKNAVNDPVGPDVGSLHVVRGGCWENNFAFCRSAVRSKYLPASRIHLNGYGFRVALSSSGIPSSSEADNK